jgi:hypothetical protein
VETGAWYDADLLHLHESQGAPLDIGADRQSSVDVQIIPWSDTP